MQFSGLIRLEDLVDKIGPTHAVKQSKVREVFNNLHRFPFVEKGHRLMLPPKTPALVRQL